MKFTVSQRVEVNKFWVSKKMQIESSFSFKMCEVSRGKLLKAQLSVNFQNPMCVSLTSFDVFELENLLLLYQNKLFWKKLLMV